MATVTTEQFHRDGSNLMHRPTGARFSYIEGTFAWHGSGLAGKELPGGEIFDVDEIAAMALQILRANELPPLQLPPAL